MSERLTLFYCMVACVVSNINLFDGQTAAKRLATDLFLENLPIFNCWKIIYKFDNEVQENINAFIQFLHNKIIIGSHSEDTNFVARYSQMCIKEYTVHRNFVFSSKSLSEATNKK